MKISYTTVPTELGWVMVGSTERGVCAVKLGDSEKELEGELKAEFLGAELERSPARLSCWAGEIARRVRGEEASSDIPLDIRATAFQKRVWRALCDIPCGRTRSYREIARSVGRPRAYRAVANACASNPVPIVVPCHRVIRSDGDLGGYGGGAERKRELLRLEHESAGGSGTSHRAARIGSRAASKTGRDSAAQLQKPRVSDRRDWTLKDAFGLGAGAGSPCSHLGPGTARCFHGPAEGSDEDNSPTNAPAG